LRLNGRVREKTRQEDRPAQVAAGEAAEKRDAAIVSQFVSKSCLVRPLRN
jgi:hypothetical protein